MEQNFLSKILQKKKEEVEAVRRAVPEERLVEEARKPRERRSLLKKLSAPGRYGTNIIAEIKRGSPSRGAIRADLDPPVYARSYERAGAAAISVLTDETFFMGSPEDLKKVRGAVGLPVLRKDFVVSTYQIYETVVWGADAVLLIVRALSPEFLKSCIALCRDLGLDALVEVHSESELETATRAGAGLVGINNRDLRTFQTDIQTSVKLARLLEPGQVAVAESGIHARAQIEELLEAGIWNFLIGESLVKAADPERVLKHLLGSETMETSSICNDVNLNADAEPPEKNRMPADRTPQVKICGLKRVEEALACVEWGASAIGCVFYPPSPRFVTDEEARAICRVLPPGVTSVGVFVDEGFAGIMEKVDRCGLKAVQLHGGESADLVQQLLREGLTVIKGVYVNGTPSLVEAESFGASAYVVECAGGVLPGGNALQWDWGAALDFSLKFPTLLAGGLNPENVARAIGAASPDAVDVCSGVEAGPGRKDLDKVKRFLEAVSRIRCSRRLRRIFQ